MNDVYDLFPRIFSKATFPVVLEIGVGQGEDTGRIVDYVAHFGRPYRYFAFEPEPKNIPVIRARPFASKIELIEAAVGDRDGDAEFIGSGSWPLSGSLKQPKNHLKSYPWISWQPPIKVAMLRLDTFVASKGLDHIDFIWADTQGSEDLLIAGGQEALKRTRYFYTETYETEEYEGQIGLKEVLKRLPGTWSVMEQWPGDIPGNSDVLLKNEDFP